MIVVGFRIPASDVVLVAALCWETEATTGVWQDKKPHIVGLSVGCFDLCFPDFLHIAPSCRDVRVFILSSDFSASRTSQVLIP